MPADAGVSLGCPLYMAKEIDILPEEIFTLPVDAFPWGVAHVRSRQEKVLARHLAGNGIAFYLPLTEPRRRRAGRMFTSHLPLFGGYLFHRATPGQRDLLWRSNVVANLIDVPDQAELGAELAQLRQLQLVGASLKPWTELLPGQPVRLVRRIHRRGGAGQGQRPTDRTHQPAEAVRVGGVRSGSAATRALRAPVGPMSAWLHGAASLRSNVFNG